MYDRKKITLFVLLIATVILGGVSLYLATQINRDQAPDDSQAGAGFCLSVIDKSINCNQSSREACLSIKTSISAADCCVASEGTAFACKPKVGAPSYCSQIDCSSRINTMSCMSIAQVISVNACSWVATSTPTPTQPTTPTPTPVSSSCKGKLSANDEICATRGETACKADSLCNWTAGTTAPANCTVQSRTISHGEESCIGQRVYRCDNGSVTPLGTCNLTPTTPVNSLCKGKLSANDEICATRGETACKADSLCNWTGTSTTPVTPSQPGTTSPGTSDEGTKDEGTKDEDPPADTCTASAPTPAQLVLPLKDAVVNTSTVNLQWQKNGTFGVNCPTNSNKYRVRIKAVGINEACPTSSLDLFNAEGDILPGDISESGIFSYSVNVFDNVKYCWAIRKNNGGLVTDTGVRTFTVDLAAVNPSPGVVADDGAGVTVTASVAGENTTGGSYNGSLPATALVSDELDPILLGMVLVIIGLTLYKFNIGKKKELE